MKITIIAVGKLKEKFWKQALEEYLKRLQSYADVHVCEIPDRDPAHFGDAKTLELEGEDIIAALPQRAHVVLLDIDGTLHSSEDIAATLPERAYIVLLDIDGTLHSSEEIADFLSVRMNEGASHIVFIIGGSLGVSQTVRKRAQTRMSLGRITLPHNLARVVLAEQIYRSFRIIRGEPYHK